MIIPVDDKNRSITVVFAGSLTGNFALAQLTYVVETHQSLAGVSIPLDWHITFNDNLG